MKFTEVRLQTFRNHEATRIECAPDQNIFLGNNGEGKTNILEAISYLCLTKSFYASSDATAVQIGQPGFRVWGKAVSDIEVPYEVEVSYRRESKEKEIAVNKGAIEDRSSVIGMFPVVVLSPENAKVTSGTPTDRRRFIDVVISQSNKSYLLDLIEYRKILRQRNRILLEAKGGQRASQDVLEPWDEGLVKKGAQISQCRARFVNEFAPYLLEAFLQIAGTGEEPSLRYDSSVGISSSMVQEEMERLCRTALDRQRPEELKLGTTLVGPHKDEIVFEINGLALKAYASQGQHKTFLVALKIAEFFYLRERCQETPVLLLDDVFSELDTPRSEKLLSMTTNLGQTFITATDEERFMANPGSRDPYRRFIVQQGRVTHATPANIAH